MGTFSKISFAIFRAPKVRFLAGKYLEVMKKTLDHCCATSTFRKDRWANGSIDLRELCDGYQGGDLECIPICLKISLAATTSNDVSINFSFGDFL